MAMLDAVLSKNIRLIDYERIIDPATGQRLVRFGKYAGIAGMIDLFRALGNRLLFLKYSTPFLHLGYTHMYVNLESAKQAVSAIGEEILLKGIPRDLSPMVFVFTGGDGNCSRGAREIFELLPHKYVKPEDLPALTRSKDPGHRFRVYGCCVGSKDYMVPKDPHSSYSRSEYYQFPERYDCNFATKIAPYSSVIVNNTYWDGRIPRLLTRKQLRDAWKKRGKGRLLAVADISCDINGSIEAMTKPPTIDEPVFVYDPMTGRTSDSIDYSGILFLAVDNLPTELPKEASCHFGEMLVPFLPAIARSAEAKTYEEMKAILPAEVAPAVITCNGELTTPYQYIAQLRKQDESKIKKVLVLGAGYVTAGLINVLSQDSDTHITIASQLLEEAEKFASIANIKAVELNVLENIPRTIELIQQHDVVISILPQFFHTQIAELCIKYKRNMLTASYIKPEMRALDEKAKQAGIVILNEIGLDPGIDHMSAVKMISEIKAKGGVVRSFRSICGGLPAPEFADNPFYYKFSWSPRGVLEAGKNSATYLQDGQIVNIPGGDLFLHAETSEIHPCFSMEVLANRDSTSYVESYGLQDATTVFRGTLRYKGYSYVMWGIKELGLLSADSYPGLDPKHPKFTTWPDFLAAFLGVHDKSQLRDAIRDKLASVPNAPDRFLNEIRRIVKALEWLGVFDEATEFVTNSTPIDTLCSLLTSRLQFERHERDMILLQHELGVEWKDGKCEKLRSTLIAFGDASGETAMAKTVGYPLGIAAELILNNKIQSRGVIGPVLPEIYEPLLKELKHRGLTFVETIV